MVRTYFNQAFHLIRQNPLFSGFYILGTGLAISMVMLLVVIAEFNLQMQQNSD